MSRSGRRGRSPSSAWTVASAAASIARPLGAGRSPARANAPPCFLLPVDIERVLRRGILSQVGRSAVVPQAFTENTGKPIALGAPVGRLAPGGTGPAMRRVGE